MTCKIHVCEVESDIEIYIQESDGIEIVIEADPSWDVPKDGGAGSGDDGDSEAMGDSDLFPIWEFASQVPYGIPVKVLGVTSPYRLLRPGSWRAPELIGRTQRYTDGEWVDADTSLGEFKGPFTIWRE